MWLGFGKNVFQTNKFIVLTNSGYELYLVSKIIIIMFSMIGARN